MAPLLTEDQSQLKTPPQGIDAYIAMMQQQGVPAKQQFQSVDFLNRTDAGTMMNDTAALYNTYGPPQGQFDAFTPDQQGQYQDPAVDMVNRFLHFRDNYRNYVNDKAPQLMQAYAPYLGQPDNAGSQVHSMPSTGMGNPNASPPPIDPHGPYGSLNPYYNPAVR